MTQVETQVCQLMRARAVLAEVDDYFIRLDDAQYLPRYAEHILLLLDVVDGLILSVMPELDTVVDSLLAYHKDHKEDLSA
jgi:hypothetical protein